MNPLSMTSRVVGHLPIPGGGKPAPRRILELDLAAGVVSAPPGTPLAAWRRRHAPTVRAIRDGLQRGARDETVAGLVVHLGGSPISISEADELAGLIADFGQHKPTLAWTESFGELSSGLAGYRVAMAAREIWLQPSGLLGLTGVALGITLLRGGFDKLGIDPEFGQRKEYKSAADQFAATEISDANREMMQRIADSLVDDTVARTAAARSLAPEVVRDALDHGPLSANAALERGLVDTLGYRDQVLASARERWLSDAGDRDGDLLYVQRYARESVADQLKGLTDRKRPEIAVVDVQGAIVFGAGSPGQASSDEISSRLREAGRNDRVKAVLLRVDSPGGSYVASDTIRREVQRLQESGRPVVAQMGSVAASGGYFVAMGADEIVAQPSTLTGSIGVLAGKFVVRRLLDRAGIVQETITAGARAGMMAPGRPFSDEEWQTLDAWLDEVYADFTAKAAADRGMPIEVLEPLARGRVWTGADAAERGLVDHLGGSALSLQRAAELAGLEPGQAQVASPPPWSFLRELRPAQSSDAETSVEALLSRLATIAGVPLPTGVLSLPWELRLR